jgi:hypothetical protein
MPLAGDSAPSIGPRNPEFEDVGLLHSRHKSINEPAIRVWPYFARLRKKCDGPLHKGTGCFCTIFYLARLTHLCKSDELMSEWRTIGPVWAFKVFVYEYGGAASAQRTRRAAPVQSGTSVFLSWSRLYLLKDWGTGRVREKEREERKRGGKWGS